MNKEELENDVNNNLTIEKLSKKHNKSNTTIRYWLCKFNLKTKPISKYEKIDWKECQKIYDTGLSWKELKKLYPHNGISWAIKNGKLKLRVASETNKITHKLGKVDYSVYRTEKHRKMMSKFGGYRENSGRCKHITFTKKDGTVVHIQGTWELKLVEFLENKNIIWERNKVGYRYVYEGKDHNYFPDFYLKDFNLFIEVKGYETDKDREKWKQFPFKLSVIKKKEIQNLETWYQKL